MINRIFFNICLIMLISCDKENRNEFATGISEKGILGRWKLVETTSSNGTAGLNKMDMSSENYIVTFYSSGKIEAPDFPCSGEYFFEKNKAGDDGDHKLSASFDKCKSSQAFWYTINGNADARIVDHNNLILNSKTCDEPCTRIYRRLKE